MPCVNNFNKTELQQNSKIMKKFALSAICTMAVALAASVAVVSCQKEKHDQSPNGNEQTVQATENMDEYLMSFKPDELFYK